KLGFFLYIVLTGVADKTFGIVYLLHNVIAGIDTCSTVNAFQLGSVSYIYPGRANVHTLETIDTVPVAQGRAILVLPELFPSIFTFPPFMVVGDDDGFLVQ